MIWTAVVRDGDRGGRDGDGGGSRDNGNGDDENDATVIMTETVRMVETVREAVDNRNGR
jgi:hypothetical protein